jgi:hypothetical protein
MAGGSMAKGGSLPYLSLRYFIPSLSSTILALVLAFVRAFPPSVLTLTLSSNIFPPLASTSVPVSRG